MLIDNSIVIPYLPRIEYSESETFATDIFKSQNNTEKRMKIVDNPKRSISMQITVKNEQELEDLENIISYAVRYGCHVPLWFSSTVTKEDGIDIWAIKCDTDFRDFYEKDYVLVGKTYAKITSFTKYEIVLDRGVTVKKGDIVAPLLYATPSNSNPYSFTTRKVGTFTLEFKELL